MQRWPFVLAALVACSPQTPAFTIPPPALGCDAAPLPLFAVLEPGVPVEVPMGLRLSCLTGKPTAVPESVIGEVLDPDNRPVAFTASGLTTKEDASGLNGAPALIVTAKIAFTPLRAGTYAIVADFQPGTGRVQRFVPAVRNRADAGVLVWPVSFPSDCQHFAATTMGTPLCLRDLAEMNAPYAVVAHGQQWPGLDVQVEGDSIFLAGFEGDLRFVTELRDDGTTLAFVRRHLCPSRHLCGFSVFKDDLWLVEPDEMGGALVTRRSRADGGCDPCRRPTESVGNLAAGPEGLLGWVNPNGINEHLLAIFPDGGTRQFPGRAKLFLADGERLWGDSRPFRVNLADGRAAQAPWEFESVLRIPLRPSSPLVRVPPVPTLVAAPDAGWPLLPLAFDGAEIQLDRYDVGPGFTLISATHTHAFALSNDRLTLKVFDR